MGKFIFLAILIVFQISRAIYLKVNNKDIKSLWVSFFIICIPFAFEKLLESYDKKINTGTLGAAFKITIPLVLVFLLAPLVNWKKFKVSFKANEWISIVFILILFSLLNPYNYLPKATLYFALFFLSHIALFHIFFNILTKKQLVDGLYDGMLTLCIIQLILAICFPVLQMKSVTTLFHDAAGEWATRLASNRVGAVGVFNHPGNLALFTVVASSFFLSTYFSNYRPKVSLAILVANTITVILTYSRTSYLTYIIILFALYYINKNARKNIFSFSVFLKFILPVAIVLAWLVFFSPFSEQFLKSDASDQYGNRLVHYLLAMNIFKASPIFGVGLNTHLAFLASHPSAATEVTFTDFFFVNPIHNIHLIILTETGLIGFTLWLLFIVRNVSRSRAQIAQQHNEILSSTFLGIIMAYCLYGMTGWAPLSSALLPFFLFISFFSIKYNFAK
jgi:O-antigen ligase